jgi:hypothetical protein
MRNPTRIVIQGVTKDGKQFRPSDWSERLSDILAYFGRDQRIRYSPLLQPIIINGVRCVAVDTALRSEQPEIYQHVIRFAESNRLNILGDIAGPIITANAA